MRRFGWALTLLTLLATATAATRGTQEGFRLLGIRSFEADLELQSLYENRRYTEKAGNTTREFTQLSFHEILTLGWRGYVYHPRLLEFAATFAFDVEQSQAETRLPGDTQRDSLNEVSPLYSISGTFLPQHPVSLSFALQKSRAYAAREYGGFTVVDTEYQQAQLNLKNDLFPTEIYASHERTDEVTRGANENRTDEEKTAGFVIHNTIGRSNSTLSYEHKDRTQTIGRAMTAQPVFTGHYVTDQWDFDNRLQFGADGFHSLASHLSHREETGTSPSTRSSIDEGLHLRHLPNLASDYSLRYSRDTVGSTQSDILSGRAALTHRLFKSLTTTAEVHGSNETFGSSGRDIRGGSLAFNYVKKIPHGTLFLDLGAGREYTDETGGGTIRPILDEAHSLTDGVPEFLNNFDVLAATVFVTDGANTTIYLLDVDYRLIPQGRRLEIRRIPGGLIPNGGAVLVDYSYQVGTPISFTTLDRRANLRLDLFGFLSLYGGVRDRDQKLRSGIDQGRLESLRDTLVGTSIRMGPATLTLEHEDYDSNLSPHVTDSAQLAVSQPLGRTQTISGNATVRKVSYGNGAGDSRFRTVSVTYTSAPLPQTSYTLTLGRDMQDDRGFSSSYTYARAEVSHRIRAVEIALSLRLSERDDDYSNERVNYMFLTIRRRF